MGEQMMMPISIEGIPDMTAMGMFDGETGHGHLVPFSMDAPKEVIRALGDVAVLTGRMMLQPKKILKVGRVTVVFWNDGSSTAVKCGENEIRDDYVAFCAALGKKIFGSNTALKRAFMDAPHETKDP